MQLFSMHDLWTAAQASVTILQQLRGLIAEEGLKLLILPLHEFSLASCLVSLGWIVIFWKNKGLLLTRLGHALHITEWLIGLVREVISWLKV